MPVLLCYADTFWANYTTFFSVTLTYQTFCLNADYTYMTFLVIIFPVDGIGRVSKVVNLTKDITPLLTDKDISRLLFFIGKSLLLLRHCKSSWDKARKKKGEPSWTILEINIKKFRKGKFALRRNFFNFMLLNGKCCWRHFANIFNYQRGFRVQISTNDHKGAISLRLLKTNTAWENYSASCRSFFSCWQKVNFDVNLQRYLDRVSLHDNRM